MGYLNYNLEKVASIVEEGMEKQALSLGALIRMGNNAATKGKSLPFIKRLQQRNRALANSDNIMSRNSQYHKAQSKLGEAADMEQAYGKPGPNSRELARLEGRRIPDNNTYATRALSNAEPGLDSAESIGRWLQARHAPMGSGDLTNIVNQLRAGWGNTFV